MSFTPYTGLKIFDAQLHLTLALYYSILILFYIFLPFYFLSRENKNSLKALGLFKEGFKKEFFAGLLLLVPTLIFLGLISQLLNKTGLVDDTFRMVLTKQNSPNLALWIILPLCIGAVAEEIFWRGYVFGAFRKKWGVLYAVVLQSILFSVCHGRSFIYFLIFGLWLTIIYEKRKNLISCIIIHAGFNFLIILGILLSIIMNQHIPAKNLEDAEITPEWWTKKPFFKIDLLQAPQEQWQYSVSKWGSQGKRFYKYEVKSLYKIIENFPGERKWCAKAHLAIGLIYYEVLHDPYRAILEFTRVTNNYPEQEEEYGQALLHLGEIYRNLGKLHNSKCYYSVFYEKYKDEKIFTSVLSKVAKTIQEITTESEKDKQLGGVGVGVGSQN